MRRWFGFALISVFAICTAMLYPAIAQRSNARDHSQTYSQIYSQQLMQSHHNDLPTATLAVAEAPRVPVTTERISYGAVSGQAITGYLARPANATTALPGLIVIHEWWGLNDNIQMMTQRLAGEGYLALAVDLYGEQVAQTPEQARSLVQTAMQSRQNLESNLTQAYQYLKTQQQATKVASIGWCFGGSWSLNTALLLPGELTATVIYYGGELVTDANRLKPLEMPILGIFGALDQNPSVAKVREFEAALKSIGKSPEIYIYEGADHAFANASGTRYNPKAAADAWNKTSAFLARYLKTPAV
jgi:carboxymethylenebutenolidase